MIIFTGFFNKNKIYLDKINKKRNRLWPLEKTQNP